MEAPDLSITDIFAGRSVLLTGGLGFLGSTVLEQLLRKTRVRTVYLLVRGKRNLSASQRLQSLLCCPLFTQLHQQAAAGQGNVFCKVKAVTGDLALPGLGLSDAEADLIRHSVDVVIHCAANVVLDADIQSTLRDNYLSTKALMQFSSEITNLKAFVHTSTFFVNNYLPRNSLVEEQIYPLNLQYDGMPVGHQEYITAMLALQPEEASNKAAQLMQELNFTSTYAFGKHLTEQLVHSTCIKPGVSKAIVRPALISGVAGAPYPGWISGYAGSPGYCMGYALGFFQGQAGVAYASDMVLDLIPCDTVAMLVIAAAAGAASSHGTAGTEHRATIYHASSSESHPYPLPQAFDALNQFWKHNPPPLRLPLTGYARVKAPHHPTARSIEFARQIASLKVHLVGYLLRWLGKSKEAYVLRKSFEAFNVQNTIAYDKSMRCSVENGRALLARMSEADRQAWQIVWEPSQMSWAEYSWTFLAGIRGLLFRMKDDIKAVEHQFVFQKAADVSVLTAGPTLASSCSSDSAEAVSDGSYAAMRAGSSSSGSSRDDSGSDDAAEVSDASVDVEATISFSIPASKVSRGVDLGHPDQHTTVYAAAD